MCIYMCVTSGRQASSQWAPAASAATPAAGGQPPNWGAVLDKGGHSPSSEFLLRRSHVRWERGVRGRGGGGEGGGRDPEVRRTPRAAGRGLGSPRPPQGGAQAPRRWDRALLEAPPAPPRARAPRGASRAPWAPAPPAAASSSPAPRRLSQSLAAEQRRAPRYRARAGAGPGTRRRAAAAAAPVPAGQLGVLPHAAGDRDRPSPGCLCVGSETCLPHRGLCCGSRAPALPPQVTAARDLALRYAHLPRRGLPPAERARPSPAPSSSGPRPRRTSPSQPSRPPPLGGSAPTGPTSQSSAVLDFPPAPSRGHCASSGAPFQTPSPFAPCPHLTPYNRSPSSLGPYPLT